jgi:hypothetical protein
MNYRLTVKDKLNWISNIYESLNNETTLVLDINFHPKYLEGTCFTGIDENKKEIAGIHFMKVEDTLHAEGEELGEIIIEEIDNFRVLFSGIGRYSCEIAIIKEQEHSKLIYPEEIK